MQTFDVICLGEAVLDLVATRRGRLRDATAFSVHSGGAPCNVAVGAARAGARVAFVGVVGDDEFGRLLRARLLGEGVACEHLRHDAERRTDLCFIAVDPSGERSFFYPAPTTARPSLRPEDVPEAAVEGAQVAHFGGGSLESEAGCAAVEKLLSVAHRAGVVVAFDPNPRLHRWADRGLLLARLSAVVPRCDVVKCSADEVEVVAGVADPEAAARALVQRGVALAVVTLGAHGALWARGDETGRIAAPVVEVVDTTGAGDAFQAALIAGVAQARREGSRPEDLSADGLRALVERACAAGSAAVTHLGAVATRG